MGLANHRRGGNGAEGQARYYGINAVRDPKNQRSDWKVSARSKARALCGQGSERAREGPGSWGIWGPSPEEDSRNSYNLQPPKFPIGENH